MKNRAFHTIRYVLLLYLGITVLLPMLMLFGTIRGHHVSTVLSSAQFWPMVKNSFLTTIIATLLSVLISFLLAFAINRSRIRYKSVWVILFSIPMLIPSISHGMGLVQLFGESGLLNTLLGIKIDIDGYPGIIMGEVMYSFPVAFLLFFDSFQYEDNAIYEAASVLGLSKWQQFRKITLPSMKQTIISAVLSVFTMVITDYGVPLITGGTVMTLPVYMYREVIGMMNFSSGAVIGVVLLLPAVIAFLLDLRNSAGQGAASTVTRGYHIAENKKRDIAIYCVFGVFLTLLCLPILAFIYLSFVKQYPIDMSLSFGTVKKLLSGGILIYLINSVALALLTALCGTCLSYFAAYTTARSGKKISNRVLHFVSLLSLAIPGVVLGLSFVFTFNKTPLYSTLFILVMVNIVHFFASPYLLAHNSLSKFNPNLEDVARTLGISRLRMLVSVYVPSTVQTIIEMYSYYFVNSMVTISAISFLVTFRTTTLSLMIPQLESQSFIEGTALVSLLILGINLFEKGVAFIIKRTLAIRALRMTQQPADPTKAP